MSPSGSLRERIAKALSRVPVDAPPTDAECAADQQLDREKKALQNEVLREDITDRRFLRSKRNAAFYGASVLLLFCIVLEAVKDLTTLDLGKLGSLNYWAAAASAITIIITIIRK